ncbi:hypothetical protein CPB83DRAFT_396608 [Crepidotus variabilis]|uniref:Uncharacterized protein n=1 Tax=Crepidotus variabilis TaxID=179855 RepID=A0A9P6EEI7_9AGAR|nr:hypothetical protein CPB83DRAFT_396608 [Crepidotus variabilis]
MMKFDFTYIKIQWEWLQLSDYLYCRFRYQHYSRRLQRSGRPSNFWAEFTSRMDSLYLPSLHLLYLSQLPKLILRWTLALSIFRHHFIYLIRHCPGLSDVIIATLEVSRRTKREIYAIDLYYRIFLCILYSIKRFILSELLLLSSGESISLILRTRFLLYLLEHLVYSLDFGYSFARYHYSCLSSYSISWRPCSSLSEPSLPLLATYLILILFPDSFISPKILIFSTIHVVI